MSMFSMTAPKKNGARAVSYFISAAIVLFMFLFSVPVSHAAKVDISSKVTWNATRSMYLPNTYTHALSFDRIVGDGGERVNGAVLVDFNSADTFDMYFSLSTLSDPGARMTRVTTETIPDLTFPYTVVDYGYKMDAPNLPSLHYNFTTLNTGFGREYLDWQLYADNPITARSVYPGAIYYTKMDGGGQVDLDRVLADNFEMKAGIKVQGISGLKIFDRLGGMVSVPEISPSAVNLLFMLLCPGLLTLRRAIRR